MAAEDETSIAEQIDENPELVGVTAAEDRQRTRDLGEEARKDVEDAVQEFYGEQSIYAPEPETDYDAVHCECGWAASNQGADYSAQALRTLAKTHATRCADGGPVAVLEVSGGEHRKKDTISGGSQ